MPDPPTLRPLQRLHDSMGQRHFNPLEQQVRANRDAPSKLPRKLHATPSEVSPYAPHDVTKVRFARCWIPGCQADPWRTLLSVQSPSPARSRRPVPCALCCAASGHLPPRVNLPLAQERIAMGPTCALGGWAIVARPTACRARRHTAQRALPLSPARPPGSCALPLLPPAEVPHLPERWRARAPSALHAAQGAPSGAAAPRASR